jgi:hypothetical protein
MLRRWLPTLAVVLVGLGFCLTAATPARAQGIDASRFYHYPFYYFPHNYWPAQSAPWPEPPGAPFQPKPAYMAFPPFHEANWRYEYWQIQRYYRGSHFWLDVF